jgi:AcrR family transcriptional regulator
MPKIVDHEQYRKELLIKSFDLFAEKGYASVTMRQIAQALGVSTGTLYHYFPSKEELFEQLMEELTQQDISQVALVVKDFSSQSEKITAAFQFLEANHDYLFKQVLLLADFYQQQSNLQEQRTLTEIFHRSFAQLEQALKSILDIHDPALGQFLSIYFDGLIWQRIYGDEVNYTKQGKILTKMLELYLEQQSKKS